MAERKKQVKKQPDRGWVVIGKPGKRQRYCPYSPGRLRAWAEWRTYKGMSV